MAEGGNSAARFKAAPNQFMPNAMNVLPRSTRTVRAYRLLAILALLPWLAGCGFNAIPDADAEARAQWAEIDTLYKRRADLVAAWTAAMASIANEERAALAAAAEARNRAAASMPEASELTDPATFLTFEENQEALGAALAGLMRAAGNHPAIKSGEAHGTISAQLGEIENRIVAARSRYMDAARIHNTALRTLPTLIWAKVWHTQSRPLQSFDSEEHGLATRASPAP